MIHHPEQTCMHLDFSTYVSSIILDALTAHNLYLHRVSWQGYVRNTELGREIFHICTGPPLRATKYRYPSGLFFMVAMAPTSASPSTSKDYKS